VEVFYAAYMLSELRRRWPRTALTALGLAVGVGLVVVVSALSTGLGRAQDQILSPLKGLGSDLSVTRPVNVNGAQLSPAEQKELERENKSAQVALKNLGKPGTHFVREVFASTAQLSFPESAINRVGRLHGVASAVGGLTLSVVHVEGKVPKTVPKPGQTASSGTLQGLANLSVTSSAVMGVDVKHQGLGPISRAQVTRGRYFTGRGGPREAVVNVAYAKTHGLHLGQKIKLVKHPFKIVGFVAPPLGGEAADIYVKLTVLQRYSGRTNRVNTIFVRATSAGLVSSLAAQIPHELAGASVTTTAQLAKRVGGSLVDAKNLTDKLGTALMAVGLVAAVLIAILLTLSSVSKRVRELGTLKAIGWPQRRVVRQVTGEALLQGLLGGAVGVAIGVAAAAVVGAVGPTLQATVPSTPETQPTGFFSFGEGSIATGTTHVVLTAPIEVTAVVLAVVLALAGGLLAGAFGGLRAARLRPADALRYLE
jgi:putative ABC transport system permease protein